MKSGQSGIYQEPFINIEIIDIFAKSFFYRHAGMTRRRRALRMLSL